MRSMIAAAVAASLIVSGCSSRPRAFTPILAAPPSGQAPFDQAAFDRAYKDCTDLLVGGKLDWEGRLASAGAGAAAGGTAAAVGGATAAAVAGYGGLAVASATIVLLPFAVIGGAVGMAKAKRARKEQAIKTAMTGCLRERGYAVVEWRRAERKKG